MEQPMEIFSKIAPSTDERFAHYKLRNIRIALAATLPGMILIFAILQVPFNVLMVMAAFLAGGFSLAYYNKWRLTALLLRNTMYVIDEDGIREIIRVRETFIDASSDIAIQRGAAAPQSIFWRKIKSVRYDSKAIIIKGDKANWQNKDIIYLPVDMERFSEIEAIIRSRTVSSKPE